MKLGDLVYIVWADSKGSDARWEYLDELDRMTPGLCKMAGFLIDNATGHKTLAFVMGTNQLMGRVTVPTRSIIHSEVLRPKGGRARGK